MHSKAFLPVLRVLWLLDFADVERRAFGKYLVQ